MQDEIKTVWEEKKIRILKMSQQIFARYGFYKSTMDDIARAMGMKKGSLYYYYKSKEEIFSDVIRYESEQFLQTAREKLAGISQPRKQIIFLVKFQLDYFKQVVNLHQLTIQVVLEVNTLITKLHRNYIDKSVKLLSEIIEAGIQKGDFKSCDATEVARAILTIAEAVKFREFQTTNVLTAGEVDYSAIENEVLYIMQLILDGLAKS